MPTLLLFVVKNRKDVTHDDLSEKKNDGEEMIDSLDPPADVIA